MQATIRPATEDDRPTTIDASRQTWEAHRARQPFAFAENGWDMLMARDYVIAFRDADGQPVTESGNLFVAEAKGQILGFVLLSWHVRSDAPVRSTGAIRDIWVAPDWRGKGIARALVDFAKARAEEQDWDGLTAQVWTGAPSADLFEAAGFAPQSTIWRFGPDRPARLIEARDTRKPAKNKWWQWLVLTAFILAVIAVSMLEP